LFQSSFRSVGQILPFQRVDVDVGVLRRNLHDEPGVGLGVPDVLVEVIHPLVAPGALQLEVHPSENGIMSANSGSSSLLPEQNLFRGHFQQLFNAFPVFQQSHQSRHVLQSDAIKQKALKGDDNKSNDIITAVSSYGDNLPQKAQDDVLPSLAQDVAVHVDHVAADGLSRVDGQRQVLVSLEDAQLGSFVNHPNRSH